MKLKTHFLPISLVLATLFLSGCESMPDSLASTVPPQVQVVDGRPEQVYVAAQQAFKRLDFVISRSVMGHIEAASAIHTSETFGDSKQLVARVSIHEAEPGTTEVELWVTEERSSQSVGGTRRQPLKDNGFFAHYFATLQQVLQEQAADKAAGKN